MVEIGDDRRLNIAGYEVKRHSFNSDYDMWAIRMKAGRKLCLQSAGAPA